MLFALDHLPFAHLQKNPKSLTKLGFCFLLTTLVVGLSPCTHASGEDGANFATAQAVEAQKEVDMLLSQDKGIASMRQLGLPTAKPSSEVLQGMKARLEAVNTEAAQIINRGELLKGLNTKAGCPSQLFNKDGKARGNCSSKAVQRPLSVNEEEELKQAKKDQLLVFVSFSMPEASLKSLAQDATKYNALLVMRGLYKDSFVKTANKLKDLGISVDINPELFETHQITAVPTFVVLQSDKPDRRLKGNVTLGFAAKKFRELDLVEEQNKKVAS